MYFTMADFLRTYFVGAIIISLLVATTDSARENSNENKILWTSDPIRDFYKQYGERRIGGASEFKGTKKLLRIEFDVDNDGNDDLLISTTMLIDGKSGTLWDIYVREGKTFRWVEGMIPLRRDACFVGYWEPLKRNVVVSYRPGGSNTGTWHAVYVKDDKIVDVPLDVENNGPDTDLGGLKRIKPEEFLFDELEKKYKDSTKPNYEPAKPVSPEADRK